ncbi:hypothetical protein [Actinokineospora sp.]|uniref:hypothetical protein n=1 Tax=Actinokineospora sp. TaxID=1872133 RepID=UPI003D6B4733
MRQASADELIVYVATGSRGPGRPIDLRPEAARRAEVMTAAATGHTRARRRAQPGIDDAT